MGRLALAFLLSAPVWAQTGAADSSAAPDPVVQHSYKFPTKGQFAHNFLVSALGPEALVREAFGAGFGQLRDSPPEWREGWDAFGKRFASDAGEHVVRMTVQYGIAAVLQEDNHYYRLGEGSFQSRALYAALHPARAHHRDGSYTISLSSLTGLASGALISRMWLPPSQQGARNVVDNALISYAVSAGFDEAREFVPDLFRKIRAK